jgi:hypothetical protein
LFDLNGRRVLNYKNSSDNNLIDVSKLSSGEYILRLITSETIIFTKKILIR